MFPSEYVFPVLTAPASEPDPDDPEVYTRPWFAWANTLFAELLENLMEREFF